MSNKKVAVLMSTYNGEKYIEEQIESILNQKNVDVNLIVRDDGSNDNTIEILKKYSKEGKLIFYIGKNLKPARSFLTLLKDAPDADYYAFADQDDYWEENKLYEAVNLMENGNPINYLIVNQLQKSEKSELKGNSVAKLYFSPLNVVDSNLNFMYKSKIDDEVSFRSAIIKNQATGCTMVMDNKLRNIINNTKFNDYVCIHDAWIYRIALLNNCEIYIDKNAYIKYRQHGDNVLGFTNGFFSTWKKRWYRFVHSESESSRCAMEFYNNNIPNITDENKKIIGTLKDYKKNIKHKFKIIFTNICHSKNKMVNFLFKLKVLFNKA